MIELLSEKQELLATLMESQKSMQKVAPKKFQEKIFLELKLEELKSREALGLLGRKHELGKLERKGIEPGCYRCSGAARGRR